MECEIEDCSNSVQAACKRCGILLCGGHRDNKSSFFKCSGCPYQEERCVDCYELGRIEKERDDEPLIIILAKKRFNYLVEKRGKDLNEKETFELEKWQKVQNIVSADLNEECEKACGYCKFKDCEYIPLAWRSDEVNQCVYCEFKIRLKHFESSFVEQVKDLYVKPRYPEVRQGKRCRKHRDKKASSPLAEDILAKWIERIEDFIIYQEADFNETTKLINRHILSMTETETLCFNCIYQRFQQLWLDNSSLRMNEVDPISVYNVLATWKEQETSTKNE